MLFNSYIFILAFLPLSLAGYYALNRIRPLYGEIFLIAMSLWFYGYFNPWYLLLISASIAVNYSLTVFMRGRSSAVRRLLLAAGCAFNVGLLFYFKYYNFFLSNVSRFFNIGFHEKNILLPLGISFFTFQQLSYLIDCYHGDISYNPVEYALFVTFFPQLVAGPIVLHTELVPQFRDPARKRPDAEYMMRGIRMFTQGLAKKLLLADVFGTVVAWCFANLDKTGPDEWILTSLAYTFQIYFDFSGYSDMASGLASMFHLELPMNFNSPYRALSFTDFWRRWHMTLTRFLRTYLYFPLGGSRRGKARTYLNTMIVFLVSGIWHGANWTFILWGVLHGALCCLDRAASSLWDRVLKPVRWLVTFILVDLLWILFRADSVRQWLDILNAIRQFRFIQLVEMNQSFVDSFFPPEMKWFFRELGLVDAGGHVQGPGARLWILFLFALSFGIVLFGKNIFRRKYRPKAAEAVTTAVLLFACILSLGKVSIFLYFNF